MKTQKQKKKQQNRFVKWVNGLSSYTKNKTINALAFFLAFFIIGGANYAIMFGQFVPTFFVLDLFIIVIAIAPIFFFKTTMFDRIYLPIILFIVTVFYTINSGYYDYFKTVLSFKDIPFIIQNIDQAGYHAGEISWWIIILNIILFLLFATGIVLYNALWRFEESNKELKIRRYKKIIFASSMLVGGLASFEFSLQMWCIAQRNDGILDIDYVNYSPNYHFSHLGMIGYYTQEARQLLFDKGASVEEIKYYLTHGSYLDDEFTGLLGKDQNQDPANVFVMMIETGDQVMLNELTTPNLWRLLNGDGASDVGGLYCDHNFSLNHSNVSEIIAINGSYPNRTLDQLKKWKFPFNLPNLLGDEGYDTYYMADIAHHNDCYNSMYFMKKFGFDTYWFHDDLLPGQPSWDYKYDNFTRDSIFIEQIVNKIKEIDQKVDKKPFYMHYITIHMHMDNNINSRNQEMFDSLEAEFGSKLDNAPESIWHNPFEKDTNAYKRYRNYTLKTMDFDKGLGMLMDCLYSSQSSEYLKNSILTVYGDHPWFESTGQGNTFAQALKNVYDFEDIKEHATILGMYNPTLNQAIEDKYHNHKFGKTTWPTVIVPTLLDLLGVKYNTRMYQGTSLFDKKTWDSTEPVYYSMWTDRYMNEHYTSDNGISITKVISDNGTKQGFIERLKQMRYENRMFNTIYQNNIFATNNYQDFMPPELVNSKKWII